MITNSYCAPCCTRLTADDDGGQHVWSASVLPRMIPKSRSPWIGETAATHRGAATAAAIHVSVDHSHYYIRLLALPLMLWVAGILPSSVLAWHGCSSASDAASGICPDGNTCCYNPAWQTSTCISGKNGALLPGDCCTDMETSTGCGEGFQCARNSTANYPYCTRVDPNDASLPNAVPRYHLCSLQPERILKEIYGLPMPSSDQEQEATTVGAVAYFSTMGPIDSNQTETVLDHAGVETVWIVIHGSARNADDYMCCAISALTLDQWRPANTTMILAPWFLSPEDPKVQLIIPSRSADSAVTYQTLLWDEYGPIDHTWRYGANAVNDNVSSYAVLDELIRRLLSDRDHRFSALKRIVVAGHSAGGQYVQRWALLSNGAAWAKHPPPYPAASSHSPPRVNTRVVVANPKSFCWLDERRMCHGTLNRPDETAIHRCPAYNEWEWGFQNSSRTADRDELTAPYVQTSIQDAGGIDAVVERYPYRDIVYLAGELDVLHNGDCEDRMQGLYRRERSANFYSSLQEIYGRPVHHRLVVSGVHHDHCLMFQSPEGRHALFGTFVRDEVAYS